MSTLSEISDAMRTLVATTARRVVAVNAGGRDAASGILWRADLIVTADEALTDDDSFEVSLPDGSTATTRLAGRDPSTDIALLRLGSATAVTDAPVSAQAVAAGHLAVAVGRGRNGEIATSGVVKECGPGWHSAAGGTIDRRILLDLSLDRRAHGGAVVDATGGLIGLAAFAPRRQALVIPAETVARIAERLATGGSIARGYLGVGLHPVAGGAGAIILSLDDNGPAKQAGLHVGDVLTAWNGEPIRGVRDVHRRLGPDAVGATVTLDLSRADRQTRVEVAVGERPHR